MIYKIIVIIILLIHTESQEAEIVQSCQLNGSELIVDYGRFTISQPANEYICKTFIEVTGAR